MKDKIIKELANKCKMTSNSKKIFYSDIYNEIIDILLREKFDENKTKSLLIELYRYAYYSEVKISIDPRGNTSFKLSILTNIKNSLEKKELTTEIITKTKEANDFMREFIDHPVEFIEEEINFYSKNPHAKF